MIIKSAEFVVSNTNPDKCPKDNRPEYAFIGRSNVGKSSLINMLCGKRIAMTSATPGKTLLINHFLVNNEWYLVDLPGYGYAQRSKKMIDKITNIIESYIQKRESLVNLFVLIDSRLEPQRIDLEFIEWLGENGIPFSLIFTKIDKLSKSKVKSNIDVFMKRLSEQWEELPVYFETSSEKGIGKDFVLDYIENINNTLQIEGV